MEKEQTQHTRRDREETNRLNILFLEDNPYDVELATHQLKRNGFEVNMIHVADLANLGDRLQKEPPDVIISDYNLNGFDGNDGLDVAKKHAPDVPFIFMTGALGEEQAVDLIQRGAADFFLKDHIASLPKKVLKALQEQKERQRRQAAEQALRDSEEHFRSLIENNSDLILIMDGDGIINYASPASSAILGYDPARLQGMVGFDLVIANHQQDIINAFQKAWEKQTTVTLSSQLTNGSNELVDTEIAFSAEVYGGETQHVIANIRDITDRKEAERQIERTHNVFQILAKVNKLIYQTDDEQDFLQRVSELIHQEGDIAFCWIGEARIVEGEKLVVPVASAGEDEGYLNKVTVKWDESEYARAAGRAINEQRTVSFNNIPNNKNFLPYEKEIREQGFMAATAIPLFVDKEQVFGTLNLYAKQPNVFQGEEANLLQQLASDIDSGLQMIRQRNQSRQAEQELAESHKLLGNITDAVPGVVYRYKVTPDGTHQFEFLSAGVEELLGYTIDEFRKLHDDDWGGILSDDYEYLLQTIQEAIQNMQSWEAEFRVKTKSGAIKWIHGASVPEPLHDDGSMVFNGIFSDVTARRMAENEVSKLNLELEQRVQKRTEELEQANKELEAFNHTVSHDLKNPIRSVDIFAKFLDKRYSDRLDDQGKEYIDNIHNSVNEMNELIHDLLQLARVGHNELQKEDIDMNAFLQGIFQDLRKHYPSRTIEFHAYEMPRAKADRNVIKYAVSNLLGNALKYTQDKEPAIIEVGGYQKNDELIYYVKDNGAGFDTAQYDDLFKAFKRLHSKQEFEGSGIGLSIVEKAIVRHGGYVCADSKEGEGATFYFSLPVK